MWYSEEGTGRLYQWQRKKFVPVGHNLGTHRRQPRRGCRGRIPTNILVGGDINGNVPTNIRGGSVVEYEFLIASVKRKQR